MAKRNTRDDNVTAAPTPKRKARKAKSAPKPKGKDAKLIAACERLAKIEKLVHLTHTDEELDDALDAFNELVGQILATPVKTIDGIKAKAVALASVYKVNSEPPDDLSNQDYRLARQIVAGLIALELEA